MNEKTDLDLENYAKNNTILQVVAGSHAYGTNLPSSDWDERGIFTDSMEKICLPFEKTEQVQYAVDDIVCYELSKYMPLLLVQNPNVIELIWTDPKDIVTKNSMGDLLLENRKEFLSLSIKDSYVGYAKSQLTRIKGHNKWLNNPQPEKEPEPQDFFSVVWNYSNDKNNNKNVPKDGYFAVYLGDNHYGLFENTGKSYQKTTWIDKRGNPNPIEKDKIKHLKEEDLQPSVIVKFNEKSFDDTHTNWKAYWHWKKNRNEKRSELEEKYGYDTKHAMHLIRLLKSGIDILETGIVPVKRPDKDFLLDIREGKYSYEEIIKISNELTEKVHSVSEKSNLPKEPNYALAKSIMLEIYSNQWNISKNELVKTIKKNTN